MRSIEVPAWPEAARVAVCFTFDIDAESGVLSQGKEYERRLTSLSEARFGIVRGLPRILDLLGEYGIAATFYTPGVTAETHPEAVRVIVEAGHEVAHHGHRHALSERLSEQEQLEELERGIAAIREVAGYAPVGYRSPSWEVTPETFRMLVDLGFSYDSSFMGDDRPYWEEHEGREIVELPIHWSLDDWPYFDWSSYRGGLLSDPAVWRDTCVAEYEVARADRRSVTYTMHPEVIGRGYRFRALADLVARLVGEGDAWFATHRDLAAVVRRTPGATGLSPSSG